jgi:hypothetical protein
MEAANGFLNSVRRRSFPLARESVHASIARVRGILRSWAILGWRALGQEGLAHSTSLLFGDLIVIAVLAQVFSKFSCVRERLVLGLLIVRLAVGFATKVVPTLLGQAGDLSKTREFCTMGTGSGCELEHALLIASLPTGHRTDKIARYPQTMLVGGERSPSLRSQTSKHPEIHWFKQMSGRSAKMIALWSLLFAVFPVRVVS